RARRLGRRLHASGRIVERTGAHRAVASDADDGTFAEPERDPGRNGVRRPSAEVVELGDRASRRSLRRDDDDRFARRARPGTGAGANLGAILGGAKGALAGILIGAGGTVAATEGKDVELPSGTVLRVRLDSPLNLQR